MFDLKDLKGVRVACFSLMNTQWYIKQMIWAGVPMDFASPFKGTRYEGAYMMDKRMGKTDKDFEEWVIDHLYYMKGEDGTIISLKDMAVRNIIVSSLGKKTSLRDLLMPLDSFVDIYINTDEFNPSVNIYFAATVSLGNKKGYEDHLKMEGFAHRLVGNKAINMVDKEISWDLLMNKFSYRSIDDPSVYKDETTSRLLGNYSSLFFSLGRSFRMEAVPAEILVDPDRYIIKIDKEMRENMLKAVKLYRKGLIFTEESKIHNTIIFELKGIYSLLGEPEKVIVIIDSFLSRTEDPILHLFKGQTLLKIVESREGITENEREDLILATEEEFQKVIQESKEGTAAACLGLLYLYSEIGENEKKDSLVVNLLREPDIFRALFSYSVRHDTSQAIYLLEHWTEVNPNDKEADSLLMRLRKYNR